MSVCLLDQSGEIVLHRNMKTAPETFVKASAPYRDGTVVAVQWLFPWYWLADLCAEAGIPCVLGHTLSMPAIHGGQAKNDTIAAHTIAVLLRGGRLPQASVSPAHMRATRDLRRRRRPLVSTRAALLAPGQPTNRPDTLPAMGTQMAAQATRDGVGRGRDAGYPAPPAQIPACGTTAPGSCLGL